MGRSIDWVLWQHRMAVIHPIGALIGKSEKERIFTLKKCSNEAAGKNTICRAIFGDATRQRYWKVKR